MDQDRIHRAAQELQVQESTRLAPVMFHGKSMLPFLEDGDDLEVVPVAWEDIQPGDIVTYRLESRFPTCRVAEKKGDHLLLTADNWRWARFEAWREDVLGRVVSRTRAGERLHLTDPEWTTYTKGVMLQYRARRTWRRVRGRGERVRFRAQDRWLRWTKGYTDLPNNVQINVSSRCNLRCRMCPYLDIHKNPNVQRYMTRETFVKMLPVVKDIRHVHFSGAGEPLFNKDLLDFMKLVRAEGSDIEIDLITNGTLLTREFAQELIRLKVYKLHISFDGMNPETVESIRRGIHASLVLDNIRMLNELKKEQNSPNPILMINYMMGYGTYREFADFIGVAKQLGVSEIQTLEMQPASAEDYADNLLHNLERDHGRDLREAIKRAARAGIRLYLPAILDHSCRHPAVPHIGEDGEVYPCCFMDYEGRDLYSAGKAVEMPHISFGNINQKSFREIWNSPKFVAFRQETKVGEFSEACRTCYNLRAETAHKVSQVLGPH